MDCIRKKKNWIEFRVSMQWKLRFICLCAMGKLYIRTSEPFSTFQITNTQMQTFLTQFLYNGTQSTLRYDYISSVLFPAWMALNRHLFAQVKYSISKNRTIFWRDIIMQYTLYTWIYLYTYTLHIRQFHTVTLLRTAMYNKIECTHE